MRDPLRGKDVEISIRLTDRLHEKWAVGLTMPDGEPEFGERQRETPPIQHEAVKKIERLQAIIDDRTAINAARRRATSNSRKALRNRGCARRATAAVLTEQRETYLWTNGKNSARPLDQPVLLWFVDRNAPKSARACAIGSISSYEPGMVWINGEYRLVEWFSHWMRLPSDPLPLSRM